MNIETKYNIGDLVQSKYTIDDDSQPVIYEVQFIDVNTCIGGIQIFYRCRPYIIEYVKNYDSTKKPENKILSIHHGTNKENNHCVPQFREDEIKECPKQYIDILKPTV